MRNVFHVKSFVRVNYIMMLQCGASLPEANWTDLFGSSSIVYPHSGRQLAHPAYPATTLHVHAGEHAHRTGGMCACNVTHC